MDSWVFGRDFCNRGNSFDGVSPSFFLSRGNGKSQRIHDDVIHAKSPLFHQGVDQARCNANFVFGGSSLAFFIDREGNDGRAMFFHQRHDRAKARSFAIPIFKVHGVHDRAASDEFHACFDDGRFSGVNHQRECGRLG